MRTNKFNQKNLLYDYWRSDHYRSIEKESKMSSSTELAKKGTALIRPEDIDDAVDGTDLLDTILSSNLERIQYKTLERTKKAWAAEERKKIKETYTTRAEKAYNEMWDTCGNSSVGHSFRTLDVQGYSVRQCDDCSFCVAPKASSDNYSAHHNNQRAKAKEMNNSLIDALVKRMIDIDIEAGVLIIPTEDDYIEPIKTTKGWFKR